jgi:asparagine synthetase B (glutamine-hydrolysing)
MCSFLVTNKLVTDLNSVNQIIKHRGPDYTNLVVYKNFTFVHNLLSITGDYTVQPFIDNDIVAIYNGEIYNYQKYGNFNSDGACLIPCYNEFGNKFCSDLDGEFAIVIVDFKNEKIIFSSDVFKTKPIFYSIEEENIGIASYSDPLLKLGFTKILKAKPNTTYVYNIKSKELTEHEVHKFDCAKQYKTSFDDWNTAFANSISKRIKNTDKKVFIGLSSGYDSGAICCELLKQNSNFKSYSVMGTENHDILSFRIDLLQKQNKPFEILYKSDPLIDRAIEHIKTKTENFKYTISSSSSDYNEFDLSLVDDNGSRYFSLICDYASREAYKIALSGQGPDEIYSDYGFNGEKIYKHSNFGGLFPKDLCSIFPWNSFFGSSMESYIAKEEYVGGSYGIEVRYPFLDKQVVQEFLWLTVELKNSNYKAPLKQYLEKNNYPYFIGKKGF